MKLAKHNSNKALANILMKSQSLVARHHPVTAPGPPGEAAGGPGGSPGDKDHAPVQWPLGLRWSADVAGAARGRPRGSMDLPPHGPVVGGHAGQGQGGQGQGGQGAGLHAASPLGPGRAGERLLEPVASLSEGVGAAAGRQGAHGQEQQQQQQLEQEQQQEQQQQQHHQVQDVRMPGPAVPFLRSASLGGQHHHHAHHQHHHQTPRKPGMMHHHPHAHLLHADGQHQQGRPPSLAGWMPPPGGSQAGLAGQHGPPTHGPPRLMSVASFPRASSLGGEHGGAGSGGGGGWGGSVHGGMHGGMRLDRHDDSRWIRIAVEDVMQSMLDDLAYGVLDEQYGGSTGTLGNGGADSMFGLPDSYESD